MLQRKADLWQHARFNFTLSFAVWLNNHWNADHMKAYHAEIALSELTCAVFKTLLSWKALKQQLSAAWINEANVWEYFQSAIWRRVRPVDWVGCWGGDLRVVIGSVCEPPKLLLTLDTAHFKERVRCNASFKRKTTSFHPHRLKTRHTRVSGVYGSRLKRFLTTELREQWQLRIINITGSHVINYSVNSVFFSLIHASKVTNIRTNMQVPYEAVLWQACVMLDMMSCYNDSAVSQHNHIPIIHWQQCCKHCHMLLLYTVYYDAQ